MTYLRVPIPKIPRTKKDDTMPRKNAQTDDDSTAGQSSSTATQSQSTSSTKRTNILLYLGIAVVVVIIIAIAYFALSSFVGGSSGPSGSQILTNATNSSLNQTQQRFVGDLAKSLNVSDLYVSYHLSNATSYVPYSSNITLAISNNQTIVSYKLGNENKTVINDVLEYSNQQSGQQISKNVTNVYYYNTNTTIMCFNQTTYSAGLETNSSLSCAHGDQGLSYIEQTPFTAVNVSSLAYLIYNNSLAYQGTKTIDGRSCDDFLISNATASNIQSNYSVYNICVDTQYGIPLYFNQTDVVSGSPSSFVFTATAVSTNVTSSELVIPQQYITAAQSII